MEQIKIKEQSAFFESFEGALQNVIELVEHQLHQQPKLKRNMDLRAYQALIYEIRLAVTKRLCTPAQKYTITLTKAQGFALMRSYLNGDLLAYNDSCFQRIFTIRAMPELDQAIN